MVIAMAGNKSDLSSRRVVEPADAESFARQNGLIFLETSAKDDINVTEAFMKITEDVVNSSSTSSDTGRGNASGGGEQ